jgi:hypothetical protein
VLGRRWLVLFAIGLVAPSLAGCTDDAPSASGESVQKGSTRGGTSSSSSGSSDPPPMVTPKPASGRWHFHDAWQGQPTITLLDAYVTLQPGRGPDGLPAAFVVVGLPAGTVVPPETGHLTLNFSWNVTGGLLNVTYRAADTNAFAPAMDVANGASLVLPITESMADVPHRASSLWAFNLTAKPGGDPPSVPSNEIHVNLTATIGRPLFIDAPHINWWKPGDVLPLVMKSEGVIETAVTPAGTFSLPKNPSADTTPAEVTRNATVPADDGRIVPEGAKSIVALLNWTTEIPDKTLLLRYRESNLGSDAFMDIAVDGATSRVFTLPVDPDQTDTTYSNRTTWEFQIVPEGDAASAFKGTYTLYAWVTRLEPAAAVAETVGTG